MFPNARATEIRTTSPATALYNCVAWAVRCENRIIWPDEEKIHAWPTNLPREDSSDNFLAFFRMCHFTDTDNNFDEAGMEYIAIYTKDKIVTHIARTTDSDLYRNKWKWTSKLGSEADIHHVDLTTIENETYGRAAYFMKRRYSPMPPPLPLLDPPAPRLVRPDGSRLL
jgi:hypothetical protein